MKVRETLKDEKVRGQAVGLIHVPILGQEEKSPLGGIHRVTLE